MKHLFDPIMNEPVPEHLLKTASDRPRAGESEPDDGEWERAKTARKARSS